MSKIYVFDIDNTICDERKTFERCLASPKDNIINLINKLYEKNDTIILYTARSWAEFKMTEHWLHNHNVKYNLLLCGKPIYDYWIDDRAINVKDINKLFNDTILG
jgi:hydroxymethylpyrimidine pyrophosphatase-like HAD family hydrolase